MQGGGGGGGTNDAKRGVWKSYPLKERWNSWPIETQHSRKGNDNPRV